jgi:hypothetical protein
LHSFFRAGPAEKIGDFLIVDPSNPKRPIVYFVELKAARNSPRAGRQLQNVDAFAKRLGLKPGQYKDFTVTLEEFLERIGAAP